MATQLTLSKIQNFREARPVDGGAGEGVLTQRRSARLSRSTVGARECRHTHDVVPTSGEGKPPRANVPPMPEVHQRSYWSLPPRTLKQQMAELVVQQAICTIKNVKQNVSTDDISLLEFMYLVFTCVSGELP